MFTFTTSDRLVVGYLTNEKYSDNLFDLYLQDDDHQNWSRNKLTEIVEEYLNNYRHLLKNTIKHLIIPELSDIIIKYVF